MSMFKLAFQNFKASFKNYLSLILSLAFTTLMLFNFLNLIESGILDELGKVNQRNIEIVLQILSFIIVCFMLFFVWYSTNVFLTKRKKDIGVYVFMGLSNQKIGYLYVIETIMIGVCALVLGIGLGILVSQLFVMILMAISRIAIEIHFSFSFTATLWTILIFSIIYLIFVIKGYISFVKSSVLELMNAYKRNEYVAKKMWILILKSIVGIIVLITGYYLATKDAGMEAMTNALLAVVLVVMGTYFIFGGLVPMIFQALSKNKKFLYKHERNLWINNVIFRIKKNYRTYAIVSVLMLCSVTALAYGFAMKNKYDGMVHFENMYTYQIMSFKDHQSDDYKKLIEKNNQIAYSSQIEVTVLNNDNVDNQYSMPKSILPYSQIEKLANDTHLEFDFPTLKDNEFIDMDQLYLMSLTSDSLKKEVINGKEYQSIASTTIPYLGYMQENMDYMIVSDSTYQSLKSSDQSFYLYNYKIVNPQNFEKSVNDIQSYKDYQGFVKIDPNRDDIQWIKILYSVSIFMFLMFVLASGCILFMKLYNDSFEDQNRYRILKKLGIHEKALKKSMKRELQFAYLAPLLVMSISSYFSVKALANVMKTTLLEVNLISVVVIWICFALFYMISLYVYYKNIFHEGSMK